MDYNIHSMKITPVQEATFVARPAALEHTAAALRQQAMIAVDTESNSLHAYQEQVCLIQFSTGEQDYLVDPLALKDLSRLGEVFAAAHIEKVFHAAEYDLICLKRDYGFEFANLFDTMIAARILGRTEFGLGALLEAEFGVQLDKKFQRANWGQRPLPRDLLAYAQLDTHYLMALRARLREELLEKDLWALAQEDFARLAQVNGGRPNGEHSEECWRLSGAQELNGQQLAVLQGLCRYREQAAKAANRPLFKVMGDHTLTAIAARCPSTLGELAQTQGMTPRQVERYGRGLLEAVRNGLKAAPIYPRRARRPDERYLERLERLRAWRKDRAQGMGLSSDVVLPRDLMEALAEQGPRDWGKLGEVMASTPWRLGRFGEEILRVLVGRV